MFYIFKNTITKHKMQKGLYMIYLLFLTIMINTLCLSSDQTTHNPSEVWTAERYVQCRNHFVVEQEKTGSFHVVHTSNATFHHIGRNQFEIKYTEFKEHRSRRAAMTAADGSCC